MSYSDITIRDSRRDNPFSWVGWTGVFTVPHTDRAGDNITWKARYHL